MKSLHEALKTHKSAFTASDVITLSSDNPKEHCFYYRANKELHCASLPFTDAEAEDVYRASTTAPFGKGSETVVDESYRRARELMVS